MAGAAERLLAPPGPFTRFQVATFIRNLRVELSGSWQMAAPLIEWNQMLSCPKCTNVADHFQKAFGTASQDWSIFHIYH